MRICPDCGSIKPDFVKFCSKDGRELVQVSCPNCRYASIAPSEKFCEKCGVEIEGVFAATVRAAKEEVASASNRA